MTPDYKKEIEELDKIIPWKDIVMMMLGPSRGLWVDAYNRVITKHTITTNDERLAVLEGIILEYRTLLLEVEGITIYPKRWKGDEEHPLEHIKTIKMLVKMLEAKK